MKSLLTIATHIRALKFLNTLLPNVKYTREERKEVKHYGIDIKREFVRASVYELLKRLYNEPNSQYHEYIETLVFENHKELFQK